MHSQPQQQIQKGLGRRTTRRKRTRKEEIKINLEIACFTYNFSKSFQCVSAVSRGHDPRALLCVGGIGAIFVHPVDCNSINAINITIIGTAVLSEASIACSKGVDSTPAPAALQQNAQTIEFCGALLTEPLSSHKFLVV